MENSIISSTEQFLVQLNQEQRYEALRELQQIIDANLFDLAVEKGDAVEVKSCPRCGSKHVARRGKDSKGNQRWLCKDCERTFSNTTNSLFATTKLDRDVWMRFTQCHVDQLPLRTTAERCGVSLKTAFFMRHRILEALLLSVPSFRAQSGMGVEIDECFIPESFKGNRKNAACPNIPRRSRRREKGHELAEQICILTGINDAGDIFYDMVGRGYINEQKAARALADKIESGAIVATDGSRAYPKALRMRNVRKHIVTKASEHGINRINHVHSMLKEFLHRFHGVATRRLENYLAWFKWVWSFKTGQGFQRMINLVIKHASHNTYKTTWRGYKQTPYPFYDYWVKQAKWDETARKALPLANLSGRISIVG